MADIDRTYTVISVHRSNGWVQISLDTEGCPWFQSICMTEDEEQRCYGKLAKGDIIYLRYLD